MFQVGGRGICRWNDRDHALLVTSATARRGSVLRGEVLMEIHVGFEIVCQCPANTPIVAMLRIHPDRRDDLASQERVDFSSLEPVHDYLDSFGNICSRIVAPAGAFSLWGEAVIRDTGKPDPVVPWAEEIPIPRLPDDALLYLMGSRYCETDLLATFAWDTFGTLAPGWSRVQAICDFVHGHLEFAYSNARSTRSAASAYNERTGVCRDFAHLAITLCRAMNIPARYCTGYLGDIGVPVGGQWHVFDARHNVPRIGRILMARGRDAADVPLITSFGPHSLLKFDVVTDEINQFARV
jgi:transglutaminase-like putative cysteine protease